MAILIDTSETLLSDLFKDVHGFRPRDIYPRFMPKHEYEKVVDKLQAQLIEVLKQEKHDEIVAHGTFELQLNNMIKMGADHEAHAFQWWLDAYEVERHPEHRAWDRQNIEHALWQQGIAFGEIDKILDNYYAGKEKLL